MADWTEADVEKLKSFWDSGKTASEIATETGRTRSAIIGKVHRLELAGRKTTGEKRIQKVNLDQKVRAERARSARRVALAIARDAAEEQTPNHARQAEDNVISFANGKSLLELSVGDCRWPIGDPQQKDFHFCGGQALRPLPYCPLHSRMAYTIPAPRRDYRARSR